MKLLVSVRSVDEALAALAGGADLIDIKEPSRGSLGKADDATINAILESVNSRAPVSAAMGELKENESPRNPSNLLAYIKFGLSGCIDTPWRGRLNAIARTTQSSIVPVAYADFVRAECPPVQDVVDFVIANRFGTMLIDTFHKDGRCLFDWLTETQIKHWVERLDEAGIALALAGSIRLEHTQAIGRIRPAWVAVRGAICGGHDRTSTVKHSLVLRFRSKLNELDDSGFVQAARRATWTN